MTDKQKQIVALWEGFEEDEPDISTERLMEMTCQAAKVDAGEVSAALHCNQPPCEHPLVEWLPGVSRADVKIGKCVSCGEQIERDMS